MLLVVYGLVVLVATVAILAYAAQGAPLPPKPVYQAPQVQEAQETPVRAAEAIWCPKCRRWRHPVTKRFVKAPL
jgi:hypothetical protein